MTDKSRITNVLQFRSALDRIATLSGPDQAQRACDGSASVALCLDPIDPAAVESIQRRANAVLEGDEWEFIAPESDGA